MNRCKKVLFFDSWTKGIHNFSPIANELSKLGWESLLVHRGSWGHDTKRPLEEKICGVLCRDILYYRTRFVHQVFRRENPSLVLILTTNYLFDRAVILAAKALGIKTCFLMHGIRLVGDKEVALRKSMPSKALFKKRWLYGNKYLKYTIPNYFISGILNSWRFLFRAEPYSIILKLFLKPHHYVLFPPPSNEIHCDLALVWGNIYKHFFIKEYGYPENRVKVVGHPPLDSVFKLMTNPLGTKDKYTFLKTHSINTERPYCVYLEDGSVEQGNADKWTTETRIEHLVEIAKLCENVGRYLVIKLHPATDKIPIETYFKGYKRVQIIKKIDLNKLVFWSDYAIGGGSTTNDIAIIMQKPLLIPAWGISKIKGELTAERLPSAILCKSPDDFIKSILNYHEIEKHKSTIRNEYIKKYITFTDGQALNRIASILIKEAGVKYNHEKNRKTFRGSAGKPLL